MSGNPWRLVPDAPPYVLPQDAEVVRTFNEKMSRNPYHILQLDFLPEPFVGDPNAPVVLLSNNPGVGARAALRRDPDFMQLVRTNLHHGKAKYPFVYLDPQLHAVGVWWHRKLKRLIDEFGECGREVVARSVVNVTYFPYASIRFRHRAVKLPSQAYSFGLVRDAVNRGAAVVLMRKGKLDLWLRAVAELEGYDRFLHLVNPRTPVISRANCHDNDFELIVRTIEAAEKRRTQRLGGTL